MGFFFARRLDDHPATTAVNTHSIAISSNVESMTDLFETTHLIVAS